MDGQKGFHQRHGDFVGLERDDSAVAANDLVVSERLCGWCAAVNSFWWAHLAGK
jgi:hypothetical protein